MSTAKILIVEDEKVVAMSLESSLNSMGYDVCGTVDRGERAIAVASDNRPDLVIMDIKIKGEMDGIDTARQLRKKFHLPCIFLTAFSDQAILDRAKEVEPLGFIIKPFNGRELKSTMEIALFKAQMEKRLRKMNHDLEDRVEKRTRKLTSEIARRKRSEKELLDKTRSLKEANKALKSMLDNREAEKKAIESEFVLHIKKLNFRGLKIQYQ